MDILPSNVAMKASHSEKPKLAQGANTFDILCADNTVLLKRLHALDLFEEEPGRCFFLYSSSQTGKSMLVQVD